MRRKTIRRTPAAVSLLAVLAAAPALAQFNTNLVVNPGAEAATGGDGSSSFAGNLPGWTVSGEMMALAYSLGCPQGYPCTAPANPGPANPGLNHFSGGNVVSSTATQLINVSFAAGAVASGGVRFNLSAWLGGYASQEDNATLSLTWLNPVGSPLGTATLAAVAAADRGSTTALLLRESSGLVPAGASSARLLLSATRVGSGTSNDGYADNLSLVLTPVPEPASAALTWVGLLAFAGLWLCRRR